MSSDEADTKVENMNNMEGAEDESKSGEENDVAAEPAKANNKASKKKAAAPKIKAPAKKRAKEAEKEVEKNINKEEEKKKDNKKKAKESSEEDEEDEGDENEQENGGHKEVPLLDQPLEMSGSRERKQVQRFTVPKVENDEQKNVVIPEGKGKPLGEIPRIENQLQRYKFDHLKPLHRICFNRIGKSTSIKKNIRSFCGYDFDKDSSEFGKKKSMLSKFNVNDLKTVCTILDLERTKKKEDLVESILTFLLNPVDSGKPLPEARSKRRSATLKTYDEESDPEPSSRKRKSPKGKAKKKNQKEESESDEDLNDLNSKEENDKEEEEEHSKTEDESEDEVFENPELNGTYVVRPKGAPKKKAAKKAPVKAKEKKAAAPPKKRAAAKRAAMKKKDESEGEEDEADKSESGGESDEDNTPLAKKGKNPPTDDEIKAYVKSILDGANLEEITMKTVCKQVYSHYPEFDLGHKKDFIKTTVKSLISS